MQLISPIFKILLLKSFINILPLRKKFSDLIAILPSPNPWEKQLCIHQINEYL